MTFSIPASRAAYAAPVTPPAGPDKIVVTGSRAAFSADTTPPFDCMMCTRTRGVPTDFGFGPLNHAVRTRLCVPARYPLITGARYALITVVEVRSYSRNSGKISCDTETRYPARRSAAATRAS